MKIAVLMSTYNGEKYLNRQLESLSKQTVIDEMTVYIRDDGSTDQTLSIIEYWSSLIKIVLYKGKNTGPAKSFWELLIKKDINADFYAFCDQDDIWDNDKIETAVAKLTNNIHLYACNCRIIDQRENILIQKRKITPPIISIPILFATGITQGCSMLFTDYLRQYIIKMNVKCIPMHDVILMLYALLYGKIFWDDIPHFSYRVHENNVIAKRNKSFTKKIETTFWNWKNSRKNSMADVANELLKNCPQMPLEDKKYLIAVAGYKCSIINRMKILFENRILGIDRKALRSYRIRIIFGIF